MRKEQNTEKIVREAMEKMDPLIRRIVISYYYNNLTLENIAESLQMPPPEVCSLLKKGICTLKNALGLQQEGEQLYINNLYLNTEVYLSCAEEAVGTWENRDSAYCSSTGAGVRK